MGSESGGVADESSILRPSQTEAELRGTGFVHLRGALRGQFSCADFARATSFVDGVAAMADQLNHHPDVELGYGKAAFTLSSHDAGGVTQRDVELAKAIAQLAREVGAEAASEAPAEYELAIDTLDAASIRDFWRVGLGYQESTADDGGVELADPRGRGPTVWFQQMGVARTDRNRIHVDVYVPAADAEARVQRILEAGGSLVTDEHAPDWWVLADEEGNELCICTSDR